MCLIPKSENLLQSTFKFDDAIVFAGDFMFDWTPQTSIVSDSLLSADIERLCC